MKVKISLSSYCSTHGMRVAMRGRHLANEKGAQSARMALRANPNTSRDCLPVYQALYGLCMASWKL